MEAVNLLPAYARPGHPLGRDRQRALSARRVLKGGIVGRCLGRSGSAAGYFLERSVVNDRRPTLANVQAADRSRRRQGRSASRGCRPAAAARMPRPAGSREARCLGSAARGPRACLARAGLPAESPRSRRRRWRRTAVRRLLLPTTAPDAAAGRTVAVAPTAFTSRVASSHVRVAVVLDRLASLPWLTNVTLVSSASGSTTGTTLSGDAFTVTAGFNPTGGAK